MHRKRKLKYIVEPRFCFAWSNLIDGEYVPKAPLRSEKPPGSCIWKASVYFQNANAAHLKGYKLQRTHNVNVLECSAGGLRPHLCQVQAPRTHHPPLQPEPWRPHTNTSLSKEAGDREASLSPKPCLPILLLYLKSFNGGIYTRCAGDWDALCVRWGQPWGERGVTMPNLLPLLFSLLPLLAPSLVLHWEAPRKGGWGPGKVNVPTLISVKAHWVRINLHFRWKGWQYKKASCFWYVRAV